MLNLGLTLCHDADQSPQLDGPHLGTLAVAQTGGWDGWQAQRVPVSGATGTHDLFPVFRGRGDAPLFNFGHWTFSR